MDCDRVIVMSGAYMARAVPLRDFGVHSGILNISTLSVLIFPQLKSKLLFSCVFFQFALVMFDWVWLQLAPSLCAHPVCLLPSYLTAGRVIEFDTPHNLLGLSDSAFSQLVESTGPSAAARLRGM